MPSSLPLSEADVINAVFDKVVAQETSDSDLPCTQEILDRCRRLQSSSPTSNLDSQLIAENGHLRDQIASFEQCSTDASNLLSTILLQLEELSASSSLLPPSLIPVVTSIQKELQQAKTSIENCNFEKFEAQEKKKKKKKKSKNKDGITVYPSDPFYEIPDSSVSTSFTSSTPKSSKTSDPVFQVVQSKKNKKNKETQTDKISNTSSSNTNNDATSNKNNNNNDPSPTQPTTINLDIYHDSNLDRVRPEQIKDTLNNINMMNNHPVVNYNITMYATYTLPKTLKKIKQNDHKDHHIYIHIMTNDGRYNKPIARINHMLNEIITILESQTTLGNIFFAECPPAFTFDPYPYNTALFNTCHHRGVNFVPTLVGEHSLFRDGFHVIGKDRHLLVKSLAAGILGINPHQQFGLHSPPLGPYGVWRHPLGSPGRPAPSRFWPPLPMFGRPLHVPSHAPKSYANVARAPRLHHRQQVVPLMGIQF